MSYRLIDANEIADKYPEVNDMKCIYADLPNGIDGKLYNFHGEEAVIDKALEIIDGCKFKYKEDECAAWDGIMWHNRALEQVRKEIEALKG